MAEVLLQQLFHNSEWKRFLESLPSQHDKDVAGRTMDWIKESLSKEFPEAVLFLNGTLVWEHKSGKLRGE